MLVVSSMLKELYSRSEIIRSSVIDGRVVSKADVKVVLQTTMPTLNSFAKSNELHTVETSTGEKGYMLEELARALDCDAELARLDGRQVDLVNSPHDKSGPPENGQHPELDFAVLQRWIDFAVKHDRTESFERLVTLLPESLRWESDG